MTAATDTFLRHFFLVIVMVWTAIIDLLVACVGFNVFLCCFGLSAILAYHFPLLFIFQGIPLLLALRKNPHTLSLSLYISIFITSPLPLVTINVLHRHCQKDFIDRHQPPSPPSVVTKNKYFKKKTQQTLLTITSWALRLIHLQNRLQRCGIDGFCLWKISSLINFRWVLFVLALDYICLMYQLFGYGKKYFSLSKSPDLSSLETYFYPPNSPKIELDKDPLLLMLPPIFSKSLSFVLLYFSMRVPLFSRINKETYMRFVENLEKH